MERKLMQEFIIPAKHGRALELNKGQVLRIQEVEGKQVGACAFFNLHDYKEVFHIGKTWTLQEYFGSFIAKKGYKRFYSKPPRENLMLTVLETTTNDHGWVMGGRCSRRLYEIRDNVRDHRSCQENLTEALQKYGLTGDDVMDVFNAFMNGTIDSDGYYRIKPPTARQGDYIDLQAEMDLLVAISACPNDTDATNDHKPKPLGVKVFE